MSQIHPHIREIYAFLKKYNIESFTKFNKNIFESVLIKFGLENLWRNIEGMTWQSELIRHPFSNNKCIFDNSFMTLLNKVYDKPWFLKFLDHMLDALITTKNIEDFQYDKFKQIIINCGFDRADTENMKFWENESKIKKKEKMSSEINDFTLGTLGHLEKSLIFKIYEEIIVNPTRYHKKSPNITPQRKRTTKIRDNLICQICNEKFEEEELQVDHIFPYGAGGSNEETNLMALCVECNKNKSARLDYYRSDEGKLKLMENIKVFVKKLPMIHDFGNWLQKIGDKRRKK